MSKETQVGSACVSRGVCMSEKEMRETDKRDRQERQTRETDRGSHEQLWQLS